MKRVLKVLTVLLVIWVGFTCYFITKHSVEAKEVKLNETIVFNDVTIKLEKIEFYNFKRKGFFNTERSEFELFRYKLLSKLPQSLAKTYMRISYLYSNPYVVNNNQLYNTALFGSIYMPNFNEPSEYFKYFGEHISINVQDSKGYGYSSGKGLQDTDNMQEKDFSIRGRNFPIERLQDGIKIIIRHLESGEEREFAIDSQDFIDYKYNDLFGKSIPFPL